MTADTSRTGFLRRNRGAGPGTSTEPGERTAVGLRSERGPVLLALMLSTSLVAIDSTILATAVPSVVNDLGGFQQFPWLFSLYLLAQAVSVPIYGKLADQVGRKPMMLIGVSVFVAGSILCGVAWSLPALIVFRGLQGLGAGAIIPMSQTILGDLYSVAERARVTGYLAGVWGASAVVGPTLGGVFSDYLSWRWIFWVNIPLGALAVWLLMRGFSERVVRTRHVIDYAGAATLAVGFSLLILALLEGGVAWAWTSPPGLLVLLGGLLLLGAFVLVERRAVEPVVPGWAVSRRILATGNLVSFCIGAMLFGLTTYVPTFAQGVLGTGALTAGFALAALTVGWPISASLAGRVYLRIGFRDTALIGAVIVLAGAGLLVLSDHRIPIWRLAAACFVVGLGMGLVNAPILVAVQSVVGWTRRGVVTGTNLFSRSVGSAVGVAVFGAIANLTLDDAPTSGSSGAAAGTLAAQDVPTLLAVSQHVFLAVAAVGVVLLVAVALVPRRPQPLFPDDPS
jgi:EmrB/QacA subfamily drug resistance transporter